MSGVPNSTYMERHASPGVEKLSLYIPIGASGAVGTMHGFGATCAKANTGIYTLTLNKGYARVLGFYGTVHRANGTNVIMVPRLPADYTAGALTLNFETVINSGVATEPSSGDFITLTIEFDAGRLT